MDPLSDSRSQSDGLSRSASGASHIWSHALYVTVSVQAKKRDKSRREQVPHSLNIIPPIPGLILSPSRSQSRREREPIPLPLNTRCSLTPSSHRIPAHRWRRSRIRQRRGCRPRSLKCLGGGGSFDETLLDLSAHRQPPSHLCPCFLPQTAAAHIFHDLLARH